MSHELHENRFYSKDEEWHPVGDQGQMIPIGATEFFNRYLSDITIDMVGIPNIMMQLTRDQLTGAVIGMQPVLGVQPWDSPSEDQFWLKDIPYHLIVRSSSDGRRNENGEPVPAEALSVVSGGYNHIGMREFCALHEEVFGKVNKAAGLLRKGKMLFLTAQGKDLEIAGRVQKNFFVAVNDMSGSGGIEGYSGQVSVICMNTMRLMQELYRERFTVRHDADAMTNLRDWFVFWKERFFDSDEMFNVIEAAYKAMADTPIEHEAGEAILDDLYAMPSVPMGIQVNDEGFAVDFDPALIPASQAAALISKSSWYNQNVKFARKARAKAHFIWDGNSEYAVDVSGSAGGHKGSAYDLYQCVTEFESHDRQRRGSDALINGGRAKRIMRASEMILRHIEYDGLFDTQKELVPVVVR